MSSGKIDKFEYLTDEEILPYDQSRTTEQAKFTYSPLGKAFEKQMKTIEDQIIKQEEIKEDVKSTEGIFPKYMRMNEIKNEIYEIKKWEEKIKWEDLKYKTKNYTYDFQQYEMHETYETIWKYLYW